MVALSTDRTRRRLLYQTLEYDHQIFVPSFRRASGQPVERLRRSALTGPVQSRGGLSCCRHVESFHGRLREECLNTSWFRNLFNARRQIAGWQREYNGRSTAFQPAISDASRFARRVTSPSTGSANRSGRRPHGNPTGSLRSALTSPPIKYHFASCITKWTENGRRRRDLRVRSAEVGSAQYSPASRPSRNSSRRTWARRLRLSPAAKLRKLRFDIRSYLLRDCTPRVFRRLRSEILRATKTQEQ